MKKTIVQPVSSQLHSFGSSEAIHDVPLQIDNIRQFDSQLKGGFSIPLQSQTPGLNTNQELDFSYLGEGYLTTTSNNYDCYINPDQHPFSLTPNYEFQEIENPRKRRTEIDANIQENAFVYKSNKNNNKKKSMEFEDHQWVSKEEVPMKRSQKLSDKITSLQKLVSPYGKTDTASVLEEAFVSIKFLQDQIQNLCETETKSQFDLRSRGLCLVPVSFYPGRVLHSLENQIDGPNSPRAPLR